MIEIDEIELLPFSSITNEDLARTGEPDVETIRRRAAHAGPIHDPRLVYPETTMSQREDTREAKAFTVEGMTCAHCVLSVREEVSEVPGVSAVDVDLANGRMTVSGQQRHIISYGCVTSTSFYVHNPG